MKSIKSKIGVVVLALFMACTEDYLEPTLITEKNDSGISSADDLEGIIFGAYERMSALGYYGRNHIVYSDLRADNAYSIGSSGRFIAMGDFVLNPNTNDVADTWDDAYEAIANANIIIDAEVTSETEQARIDQIKGEAYAVRALSHMDLLAWYGQQYSGGTLGIPYIDTYLGEDLTPDRLSVAEVWTKIGQDFDKATELMSEAENTSSVRLTTYGVAALKARYYLYTGQFDKVIPEAEYIINSGAFALATGSDYAASFLESGGSSAIFQLAYNSSDNLGNTSLNAILNPLTYGDIVFTDDLVNLYEPSDVRGDLFAPGIDDPTLNRLVGKYSRQTADDNVQVARYAEVILNYAEALLREGNAEAALTELNKIPAAVGASLYTSATLDNILLERRKELAMEGFRFHDLMRNQMDIMKVDAGQSFSGDKVAFGEARIAFPIPQIEINGNSQIAQNPGY